MKRIFSVLVMLCAFSLFAAELVVPLRTGLGKAGSILGANLPWNENFTQVVTGKTVQVGRVVFYLAQSKYGLMLQYSETAD